MLRISGVESYHGAVLSEYEANGYDGSDFFAIVWDEASQGLKFIQWGTTRAVMENCSCEVDATDEVRAKAAAVLLDINLTILTRLDERDSRKPAVGREATLKRDRRVRSNTKGEKMTLVPEGTRIKVLAIKEDFFSHARGGNGGGFGYVITPYTCKCLVFQNDGEAIMPTLWVKPEDLEILNPEQYQATAEVVLLRAEARSRESWRVATYIDRSTVIL